MQDAIRRKRDLLFIMSPNSGILDAWLPVLERINASGRVRIHALVPWQRTLLNLRPDDFLVRIATSIFSSIHYCKPNGVWAGARDLGQARAKLQCTQKLNGAIKRITGYQDTASRDTDPTTREREAKKYFLKAGLNRGSPILCDISEWEKPYFAALLNITPETRIYSAAHGIDLRSLCKSTDLSESRTLPKNIEERLVLQFALGESERPYYLTKLNISPKKLCISGVFRHDPVWRRKIQIIARNSKPIDFPYIFIASRNANKTFLPLDEKKRIYQIIQKEARRRSLAMVIRRHPLEGNKRAIDRMLGKSGDVETWLDTMRHPLDIGADCRLAITLYSSVAVDMAAMNVPTIEPIDYGNCPKTASNIRLDSRGNPTSFYIKHGIVHDASNAEELSCLMDHFAPEAGRSVKESSPAYRSLYADPTDSIRMAAECVLESIAS